jgi:hypothetical protein
MVADGKNIDGIGKCHKIKLQVADYELESGFYIVPLGRVDVVLGILCYQHRDNIARTTILSAKITLAIISAKMSRELRYFQNIAILSYISR